MKSIAPISTIFAALAISLLWAGCGASVETGAVGDVLASPDPGGGSGHRMDDAAANLGYSPMAPMTETKVEAGGKTHLSFSLSAGYCYLFGARGSDGVEKISMKIMRRSHLISADLAMRFEAWADTCAEEDTEVMVNVEILSGSGKLAFAPYRAPRERVLDRVGPPLRPFDPEPGSRALAGFAERTLAAAGYEPAKTVFEGHVESIQRQAFEAGIPPGACGIVSAYASHGITDLDLQLSSSRERIFSDRSRGPISRVPVCSKGSEAWSGELIVLGGEGEAIVTVNLLPTLDIEGADAAGNLPVLEGNAQMLGADMIPLRVVCLERAGDDRAWKASVELEGGRCYGLVAGGAPMAGVRVDFPGGESEGRFWKGPGNKAVITFCLETPRRVEMVVDADGEVRPKTILYAPREKEKQVSDIDP